MGKYKKIDQLESRSLRPECMYICTLDVAEAICGLHITLTGATCDLPITLTGKVCKPHECVADFSSFPMSVPDSMREVS